jgi:TniQ
MTDIDNEWALVNPEPTLGIPKRSQLIRLAPCGLGTPFVESLGSYFLRLADAHGVSPQVMIREVVFPHYYTEDNKKSWHCGDYWKKTTCITPGKHNELWVHRLGELTRMDGLEGLTLGFLRGRVSNLGLTSVEGRWCPICFQEDRTGTPYGQLLWAIDAVTCCPKHKIKLIRKCDCKKDRSARARYIKHLPQICSKCGYELEVDQDQALVIAEPLELLHAGLVADLLGTGEHLMAMTKNPGISEFLQDSIRENASGNASLLSKQLGVSKSKMHSWSHGRNIPEFREIVQIAAAHCCPIVDVLTGRSGGVIGKQMLERPPLPHRAKSRSSRGRDSICWEKINTALKEQLQLHPPISLADAARRLGMRPDHLRHATPELCAAISLRWQEYRTAQAQERDVEVEQRTMLAARLMAESGVIPTTRRLMAECISVQHLLSGRKRFQEICMTVRRELLGEDGGTRRSSPN